MNQDYIAKFLCEEKDEAITMCYGNCYLSKELKKTEEKEQNQLPSILKLKVEALFFYEQNNLLPNLFIGDMLKHNTGYLYAKASTLPSGIFHPPPIFML
ncbi:MAG: hypothetical protein AAGI07_02065 [Bacteroidota bacterium]